MVCQLDSDVRVNVIVVSETGTKGRYKRTRILSLPLAGAASAPRNRSRYMFIAVEKRYRDAVVLFDALGGIDHDFAIHLGQLVNLSDHRWVATHLVEGKIHDLANVLHA